MAQILIQMKNLNKTNQVTLFLISVLFLSISIGARSISESSYLGSLGIIRHDVDSAALVNIQYR
jgi:hypothetical protein